jgi:hypothetical protein
MRENGSMKAFLVACCGCGAVLMGDGTRGPSIMTEGLLDVSRIQKMGDELASFDGVPDADAAAVKAGWKIERGLRSNHRCPECDFEPEQRTGMIIDTRTMEQVA